MTAYVDNMRAKYGRMKMCHLIADTEAELHAVAAKIGVARKWFQAPHLTIYVKYSAMSKMEYRMTHNLKSMATPQVWEAFRNAAAHTAAGLLEMAKYWVELQSRGEDLSSYHNPMMSFLPDVASGKLMPDALLRYGGTPAIVQMIARLVPEDQKN